MPTRPGPVERLAEVTLKPIVQQWTFEHRMAKLEELLRGGHDVKVVIQPEARQGPARELSMRLLDRITARLVPFVATQSYRRQEGANWVMALSPSD